MKSVNVVYLLCAAIVIAGCSFGAKQTARQQTTLEQEPAGEMVSIPTGSFHMGDLSRGWESDSGEQPARRETPWRSAGLMPAVWNYNNKDHYTFHSGRVVKVTKRYPPDNIPVHRVTVPAFRLGKYEVTFAQWDACVADGGCNGYTPDDKGWGRGNQPVINVSWDDVQSFIDWLNNKTGGKFRLPTEAEWEYAARAGTTTKYSWGNDIGSNRANCDNDDCGDSWDYTAPVGSFPANPWGLHDMHGNVWEWVQDCLNYDYVGAPTDGSAWTSDNCSRRVFRGGSWFFNAWALRSATRYGDDRSDRSHDDGFRLAQDE